ncbi:patatin-like phospholipase family protein [Nonomuraea sp. CA-143628]|uniref:patatin-like phospholipase family protein n=1 Tax=Nonomuraea sp. CA-143628 TaxID=3239997 RepID=UPI003D93AC08
MNRTSRALVLGPGGVPGTAWMAGLAAGLRHRGVDLADADLIVGTSAGAIVGAMLATGQDLDRLATRTGPDRDPRQDRDGRSTASPTSPPAYPQTDSRADSRTESRTDPPTNSQAGSRTDSPTRPRTDPARMAEVFTVLGDPTLEPREARRRVGRIALEAPTILEEERLALMESLINARQWPDRRLLITAVNAETGEPKVWDRESGAPLVAAVAASSAMPGAYPPITINGHRYMDGALAGGANVALATGARVVLLVEPLAHLFPREPLDFPREPFDGLGADTAVAVSPDASSLKAFGSDMSDVTSWQPAFHAGVSQAEHEAERLRAAWPATTLPAETVGKQPLA